MTLTILTIPCLSDNYAFLLHDPASGETAVVDAPEAAPILSTLEDKGWALNHILLTHHHSDHGFTNIKPCDSILLATGS